MSKLNELGDLGDRMMTGHSYSQGGAVGSSHGGALNTYKSTSSSHHSTPSSDKHTTPYSQDNAWDYIRDVNKIKNKVTPDEIITGIDYELKKQVIKNKELAKHAVVTNLKKDSKYYSKLHMMGIDPDDQDEAIMEVMTVLKAQRLAKKNGDFYK
jgi:hypothetical protein